MFGNSGLGAREYFIKPSSRCYIILLMHIKKKEAFSLRREKLSLGEISNRLGVANGAPVVLGNLQNVDCTVVFI